jgi:hypothetical protein
VQVLPVVFSQRDRLKQEAAAWPTITVNTTQPHDAPAWNGFTLSSSVSQIDLVAGLLRLSTTVSAVGDYQDAYSPFGVSLGPNTSLIITVGGE